MAWIPNVNPSELIESSWGNTIRDHVVNTFASATERAAAVPSPTPGMVSWLADSQRLEVWTTQTSPASWRKPWGLPWGLQGYNVITDVPVDTNIRYLIPPGAFPVRLSNRMSVVEVGLNLIKDANVGAVRVRFENGGVYGLFGWFTLSPNFQQRVFVSDQFPNDSLSGLGVTIQTDNGAATMSYGRWRVLDLGPHPLTLN